MTGEISVNSRVVPMSFHGVAIVLQLDKMLTLGRGVTGYTSPTYIYF